MRAKNIDFRKITDNFWLVSINNKLRKLVEEYPGVDLANSVLCYGYIDHEAGLSLEVLALSHLKMLRKFMFLSQERIYLLKFVLAQLKRVIYTFLRIGMANLEKDLLLK